MQTRFTTTNRPGLTAWAIRWKHVPAAATLLFVIALTLPNGLAQEDAHSTKSKPLVFGAALKKRLQQRKGVTTTGRQQLLAGVIKFQHQNGIAIVLDRRLDPRQSLQFQTQYVTTQQTLEQLATAVQSQASFCEGFVFIGPPDAAARLQTLTELKAQAVRDARRKLPREILANLAKAQFKGWPKLAEPRSLITYAATAVGLTVTNPEQIPHDLWRPVEVPSLAFVDYASLILNQFDLSFEISEAGTLQITPLPEVIAIERRHRVSSRDKAKVQASLTKQYPDLQVDWKGSTAVISATVETHENIAALLRGEAEPVVEAAGLATRDFTFSSKDQRFGDLLASLKASEINVVIQGKSDAELRPFLLQRATRSFEKTPGHEFFPQLFAPWPATVTVQPQQVLIEFQ